MSIYTGEPQSVNIGTPIDWISDLIDLHRLPGETLADFKLRVLDNYIHPANSSYNGLYNGMSRELGEDAYTGGIVIDLERIDGVPLLDKDTVIEINARGLWQGTQPLSQEFIQDGLWDLDTELTFDFHSRTDSFFLVDLLANLNASTGLEAIKWGTASDWDKARNLKQVSSFRYFDKSLKQNKLQTFYDELDVGNWIRSVQWSSDTGIFRQIANLADLAGCEEYFLEPFERTVHTFVAPPTGRVRVFYSDFPLIVPISTVGIRALRDHHTMNLYTEQITNELGDLVDGIPTVQGADFVNELFSVVPMYWGE